MEEPLSLMSYKYRSHFLDLTSYNYVRLNLSLPLTFVLCLILSTSPLSSIPLIPSSLLLPSQPPPHPTPPKPAHLTTASHLSHIITTLNSRGQSSQKEQWAKPLGEKNETKVDKECAQLPSYSTTPQRQLLAALRFFLKLYFHIQNGLCFPFVIHVFFFYVPLIFLFILARGTLTRGLVEILSGLTFCVFFCGYYCPFERNMILVSAYILHFSQGIVKHLRLVRLCCSGDRHLTHEQ